MKRWTATFIRGARQLTAQETSVRATAQERMDTASGNPARERGSMKIGANINIEKNEHSDEELCVRERVLAAVESEVVRLLDYHCQSTCPRVTGDMDVINDAEELGADHVEAQISYC